MTPSQRLLIAINLSVTVMSLLQGYYRYQGMSAAEATQSAPTAVISSPFEVAQTPARELQQQRQSQRSPFSVFNFLGGGGGGRSGAQQQQTPFLCPNPNFMRKHLCEFCTTDKDAFDFSQRRVPSTNVNSVMFGYPGFRAEGRSCVNEAPVKVVTCTMSTGRCMALGNNCVLQHAAYDGQLDYHNITCN